MGQTEGQMHERVRVDPYGAVCYDVDVSGVARNLIWVGLIVNVGFVLG